MENENYLLPSVEEAVMAAAKSIDTAGSEVSRSVRNLDNTIKAANAAARDIKIAGMWLSGAIAFLTVVQIISQFN